MIKMYNNNNAAKRRLYLRSPSLPLFPQCPINELKSLHWWSQKHEGAETSHVILYNRIHENLTQVLKIWGSNIPWQVCFSALSPKCLSLSRRNTEIFFVLFTSTCVWIQSVMQPWKKVCADGRTRKPNITTKLYHLVKITVFSHLCAPL